MRRFRLLLALAASLILGPSTVFAQGVCPTNTFGQASAPITALPYTLGQGDFCLMKVFNSSGAGVVSIPAPGTAGGFFGNYGVFIENIGTGTITLTPLAPAVGGGAAPTINGAATVALTQNQGGFLALGTDGKWYLASH
jgi:hypothetical protein